MTHPESPQRGFSPAHDDYCRIFGRILFDTFLRIESLEKQFGPLHESFTAQTEMLRTQLAAAKREIEEMQRSRSPNGFLRHDSDEVEADTLQRAVQ